MFCIIFHFKTQFCLIKCSALTRTKHYYHNEACKHIKLYKIMFYHGRYMLNITYNINHSPTQINIA